MTLELLVLLCVSRAQPGVAVLLGPLPLFFCKCCC
jgi:hypothetical protein